MAAVGAAGERPAAGGDADPGPRVGPGRPGPARAAGVERAGLRRELHPRGPGTAALNLLCLRMPGIAWAPLGQRRRRRSSGRGRPGRAGRLGMTRLSMTWLDVIWPGVTRLGKRR